MVEKYDEQLLLGYIEGELTTSERAQVEELLRNDPRLGQLLRAMGVDRQSLRDLSDPVAPEWLMDEVDRQLERAMLVEFSPADGTAEVLRNHTVLRRLAMFGAVAATIAVLATVVISTVTGLTPPDALVINTKPPQPEIKPTAPATQVAKVDKPAPAVAVKPAPAIAVVTPATTPAVAPQPEPVKPVPVAMTPTPAPVTPEAPVKAATNVTAELPPKEDPSKMPPDLSAAIQVPPNADVITAPAPKPLRKTALEMQRETSRMVNLLPLRPELAQGLELHLAVRDMAAAKKLLDSLAAPAPAAVKPDDANPNSVEHRGVAERYNWRFVAADVMKLSQKLQATPAVVAEVQWRQRPGIAPVRLEPAAAPAAWPTLIPDYNAILQQQVPQEKSDTAPSTVEVPVWIEVVNPAPTLPPLGPVPPAPAAPAAPAAPPAAPVR
jgi:anti-sigma factor RsiW